MSKGFIVGNGGGDVLYSISCVYPEGSILTCKDEAGTIELKADDQSGLWIFSLPFPGKWTVTSVDPADSTKTKSQTVELTAEGQSVSVELRYELVLFDNGTIHPDLGSFQNISSASISGGLITTSTNSGSGNYWTFANKVPLGTYGKTLCIKMHITSVYSTYVPLRIGAFNAKPASGAYGSNESKVVAATSIKSATSDFAEFTVDISALGSADYYLASIFVGSCKISRMWIV